MMLMPVVAVVDLAWVGTSWAILHPGEDPQALEAHQTAQQMGWLCVTYQDQLNQVETMCTQKRLTSESIKMQCA